MKGIIMGKFYRKILWNLIFFISFIVVLTFIFTLLIYYDDFCSNLSRSHMNTVKMFDDKLNISFRKIIAMSDSLYINKIIREILQKNYSDDYDSIIKIKNIVTDQSKYYNDIYYQLDILSLNTKKFTTYASIANDYTKYSYELYKDSEWLRKVMEYDGKVAWFNYQEALNQKDDNRHFFVARVIKNMQLNKPVGVLVITFNSDIISNEFDEVLFGEVNMFFVDDKCNLIARQGNSSYYNSKVFRNNIIGDEGSFIQKEKGKNLLNVYYKNQLTGWYTILQIEQPTLISLITSMLLPLLILLCIAFVFIWSLSYIQIKKLFKPIHIITNEMKKVENGNFNRPDLNIERDDEIGMLNRGYINMIERLDVLMKNLIENQEKKRKTELAALQAQINPHFLYNTLSTVRFLILEKNEDDALQVLVSLAKLLNMNLSIESEFITIEEEVEALKSYCLIQKCRYDKFDIDIMVEDKAYDCLIPKLLIQPLVENSIFHGFSNINKNGLIQIRITEVNKKLRIEIIDNGKGFYVDESKLYKDNLQNSKNIGISNVNNRLILHYGISARLHIASSKGEGTRIYFDIPIQRRQKIND